MKEILRSKPKQSKQTMVDFTSSEFDYSTNQIQVLQKQLELKDQEF